MKAIMITTQQQEVFFGYVEDDQNMNARTMALKGARCAIRWATIGMAELAVDGPNEKSLIGSSADIEAIHDITAVWAVTPEAEQKWLGA